VDVGLVGDVVVNLAGLVVRTGDVDILADAPTTLNELWQYRLFLLKTPRCERLRNLTQYAYRGPGLGPSGHALTAGAAVKPTVQ